MSTQLIQMFKNCALYQISDFKHKANHFLSINSSSLPSSSDCTTVVTVIQADDALKRTADKQQKCSI